MVIVLGSLVVSATIVASQIGEPSIFPPLIPACMDNAVLASFATASTSVEKRFWSSDCEASSVELSFVVVLLLSFLHALNINAVDNNNVDNERILIFIKWIVCLLLMIDLKSKTGFKL